MSEYRCDKEDRPVEPHSESENPEQWCDILDWELSRSETMENEIVELNNVVDNLTERNKKLALVIGSLVKKNSDLEKTLEEAEVRADKNEKKVRDLVDLLLPFAFHAKEMIRSGDWYKDNDHHLMVRKSGKSTLRWGDFDDVRKYFDCKEASE